MQALPSPDKSWKRNPREKVLGPLYNTPPPPRNIFAVRIGACFPILLHSVVHPLQTSGTPIPIGLKPGPLTWN